MAREIYPNTTDEDIALMDTILLVGNIQHKYAIRLQAVLGRARKRSTDNTAAFLGINIVTVSK
jgi:hypothetical protein